MKKMTMREAIREAMAEEMRRDADVFLIGEDIGHYGGNLQVTAGLWAEFGSARVIDTPISESAIVGAAAGAALVGMRPVVEIMFADFLPVAADQIINFAAKMCYSHNGEASIPLVIRTTFGGGSRTGMYHSQNFEAWLAHIPGIKVVMPSTAADAKGLLKAAIRDENPVIYLEHKLLYGVRDEIPENDYIVPIGKAEIRKQGKDATIVACGRMVPKALSAANTLLNEGIDAEVIDLRTIQPLDKETIINSVIKTSRLIIAHEACLTGGIGGEIAALAAKEAFGYLDAPIGRIGAPFTPVPFSATLEDYYIPSEEDILAEVRGLLG
jgi:pyruvate/2-oxoglutarate/acetoin dehydrogenase E1 component